MQNVQTFTMKSGTELILQGIQYSVHKCFPEKKVVQLMRSSNESIMEMPFDSWFQAYADGDLRPKCDSGAMGEGRELKATVMINDLPEDGRKKFLRKCSYVNAFIALREVEETTVVKVERMIKSVAAKLEDFSPPGSSSVRRWVSRVDRAGGDRHALMPFVKQPRPRKGYATDIRKKVVDILLEKYCTSQRIDLKYAWETFVIPEVNKMNLKSIPDYGTVRRWLYEDTRAYDRYSKRHSAGRARNKFRSSMQTEAPKRILEIVEFDFTPLDIWVLDEIRRVIMGRVQLGIMIDRFSRMPLGFSLTFGGESATAFIKCLKHAVLPKTYVKEKYPGIRSDWPAHGVFGRLRLDNGPANHSTAVKEACAELGIELEYTPTKQPWLKGCVESFMARAAKKMQTLPGATFSNFMKREGYDPEKHVALTLSDLEEVLHRWIIDEYANTLHSGLRMTPREAWELGLSTYHPPLPVDLEVLERVGGHCKTVSLTHSGIRMHSSLRYASVELKAIRNAKANEGKRMLVEIRHYEDDLGYIYVKNPVTNKFIKVLEGDQHYSAGVTLHQHLEASRLARAKHKTTPTIAQLIEAKEELEARVEQFIAKSRPGGFPKHSNVRKAALSAQLEESDKPGIVRSDDDDDFDVVELDITN